MLILVLAKADLITKGQSCKRGTVGASGASGINMIFALLEGALGSLQVQEDWLQPASLGTRVSYLEESPCSSGSSYPAERGRDESRVPSLRSFETF